MLSAIYPLKTKNLASPLKISVLGDGKKSPFIVLIIACGSVIFQAGPGNSQKKDILETLPETDHTIC